MADQRKTLLDQLAKIQEQLHEFDKQKLDALRQEAGELGYDLVERGTTKRGRKAPGERRTYNIDPVKTVETQFKRSFTKAKAAGSSDSEALKIANDTAALTAQKKDVSFTPHKKPPTK